MAQPNKASRLLDEAGLTVGIETVAECLDIHRSTAYDLARRDELGVRVLKVGRRLRVPTAELRRVLGLDQPVIAKEPARPPTRFGRTPDLGGAA